MREAERNVLAIGAERHGVFTDALAIAAGVHPRAIQRRVQSGEFVRLHTGVLRSAASPPSRESELQAALDWAGEGAMFAFDTAAGLYGIDGWGKGAPELWIPRKKRTAGVICHRLLPTSPRVIARAVRGFPATTPERTLWDLASVASPMRLLLASEDLLRRRTTHLQKLWPTLHDLRRRGCPSVAAFEALLNTLDPDTTRLRSRFESELKRVLREVDRPARVDFSVEINGRRFVLDVAFPEAMLGIEAHSIKWHMIERMRYDADRDRLLTLAGWRILYFTWEDVMADPRKVRSQVQAALDMTPTASLLETRHPLSLL